MNISEAARLSGLPAKTIRYYESIGLLQVAHRDENGYRLYQQKDVEQLRFLHHARQVGFSLEECRHLLGLYLNPERRSAEVKALVLSKLTDIDLQLTNLKQMKKTLQAMANQCAGDENADCPIIDTLAGEADV